MILVELRRELHDLRWGSIGYGLGLAIYVLIMIFFFPTVRDNAAVYQNMLDAYPKALREIFGIEDMTTLPGFIGAEVLSLIWPIVVAVFAITAAAGFVAGEIERGTVDLWLSVPVRRWRLLTGKFLGLALALGSVVLATIVGLVVGAPLVGESLSVTGLCALAVILYVFALAVAGIATLLSSLLSERGKAGGLAGLLILLSYLAWVVAGLSKRWDWLRFVSIFSAFDPRPALADGVLNMLHIAVLLAVTLASMCAALLVFERRDMV